MKLKRIMAIVLCFAMVLSTMSFNVFAEESVTETTFVAKIGDVEYTTFDEALSETSGMTGDVTVEIYNKVTLAQSLSGSYDSITFIGNGGDAEIYLDVQGYITAPGKAVAFKDLTLSKSEGGFISNAGFMNVAFGVYDVNKATYTNCTFANGSYASSGKVLYTDCTFYRSHDKYGLWAYGNVDCTVDGCKFADYRGIKMYAEGKEKSTELTVKNTDFSQVNNKPAIVLTYGESVTLEDNTYSDTGVFELDLDGEPNGTEVTSDVAPTCKNDSGACGVLVDGKIYTTVAQAAEVAISGSTVTLLHDSTETVEFDEGVILDKGNFTAENVTVNTPVAKVNGVSYTTLKAAIEAANAGDTVTIMEGTYAVPSMKAGITIEGGGNVLLEGTLSGSLENLTLKNLHIKGSNAQRWAYAKGDLVFENVTFEATSVYALHFDGITEGAKLLYKDCTIIGWAAMGGSPESCVFDGCTFKDNGKYGLIRTFFDSEIKNCTFDVDGADQTDAYQDGIHAAGSTIKVYNCTNENGELMDIINATSSEAGDRAYVYVDDNLALVSSVAVKVSTKDELNEAIKNASDKDTITLTADIDYGSEQLKLDKPIILDLGGKTLTTSNAWGGMSVKNNPTIKNGTIVHASNTAAIKVWNATAFEDLVIDVQGKGDANKTIGGIVLQSGTTTRVDSMKNVTIKGVALTNGIETYNCGDATEDVIGSMENVSIDALGTGMLISAPCGTATNCEINGGKNGIEIWIKGNYSAKLDLVDCDVVGGVYAHDEFNSNPGIQNIGTISLTADANSTGADEDDITLTIARAENVEGVLETVMNNSQAKVGDTYYADLHEAMVACKSGETVLLIADVDLAGIEWEPVSFKGTFDGQDHTISNLTINKPGVSNTGFITSLNGAFKNVTFTNPSVVGGENTGVVAGRAGGSAALAENITVNGTIKVETTHSGYARAGVIVGGWAYGNYKDITVDGGDKTTSYIKHTGGGDGRYVAGIVGHADDVASYENCTVKNITIRGGWLCGGIAGPGPSDGKAIDCAVENVDMGADYSGGMFGWYYGAGTIENGTIKNVAFIDGNSGNGVIGGYAPNDTATVSNVTFENVTNGSVALIDLVAEVNGDSYLDLDSAIAAAQSGDTIVLLRDISKTITLGAKANGVVLDLNGLTHKTNIIIEEGITIEIKNGTIVNNDSSKSAIETKGITTITNVDIQSARHCVRVEGGLTTIKGGNYLIIGSAEMTQHAVNVSDGGEVVIYNGTFTGPMGTGADSGSAVCVQAGSKVTILDGSFTNGMLSTLDVKEGATLKISGGSFDQDPTDYVAENMISVKDTETGLWSVKRKVTPGGSYGGSSVVTKYTLTFETNGGKTVNKITKAMNTIVDLSECTTEKDGYIFDGWYADKDFNNVVTSVKLTKNTTVYAKWTKEAETDKPGTEDKDLFVDVKTGDWFYENVKYVVKNKLMNGVSEDQFAPNDTLTRAMLVTILYRLESEPETDNVSFTDVKPEEYYANAVSWAKQKGIVNGITETEFAPNSNITREQIATIIHRYADFKGYDVSVSENTNIFSYDDAESISKYAVASMEYAVGSGLIQGKSATTLNPKDNATRAEIAAILQRFIEANKQ